MTHVFHASLGAAAFSFGLGLAFVINPLLPF
jgi:hypothetical protein